MVPIGWCAARLCPDPGGAAADSVIAEKGTGSRNPVGISGNVTATWAVPFPQPQADGPSQKGDRHRRQSPDISMDTLIEARAPLRPGQTASGGQVIGPCRPAGLMEPLHACYGPCRGRKRPRPGSRPNQFALQPRTQRPGVSDCPDLGVMAGQLVGDLTGCVRRTVVDNQQFEAIGQLGGHVQDLLHSVGQGGLGVLDGQKHCKRAFQRCFPLRKGEEELRW